MQRESIKDYKTGSLLVFDADQNGNKYKLGLIDNLSSLGFL